MKTLARTKIVTKDEYEISTTTFEAFFEHTFERGSGYSFPSDEFGTVIIEGLSPAALANLDKCLNGLDSVKPAVLHEWTHTDLLCLCGSGKPRYDLSDARGIFCAYVCICCESEVTGRYRSDIFSDSSYDADEAFDETY